MTIADILKREIGKAESLRQVSIGSGVTYSILHEFYHADANLRLSNVQALVDYFGYRLVRKARRKPAKRKR